MDSPKYPDQRDTLEGLLKLTHLSLEELAARVGIKAGTFRKYVAGYQPCGQQTLNRIQDVVKWELERQQRAIAKIPEVELHEEAINYGTQILKLPADKQALVKSLIDQLAGNVDKIADSAARRAIADVKNPGVVYKRVRKGKNAADRILEAVKEAASGPGKPAKK